MKKEEEEEEEGEQKEELKQVKREVRSCANIYDWETNEKQKAAERMGFK